MKIQRRRINGKHLFKVWHRGEIAAGENLFELIRSLIK